MNYLPVLKSLSGLLALHQYLLKIYHKHLCLILNMITQGLQHKLSTEEYRELSSGFNTKNHRFKVRANNGQDIINTTL
ncbi:hypothetical protein BIY23_04755 [Wolbachia pipientis]|uniref:Uncharacterized protein n=1 Tax=Wolbachia pipientis TaxID=955 RepID=A0A1E7QK59_WOLPI|nr:hypothetical protein [Wolbachia pipientis]OEY86833.1 hypothetical protein BIY23_04755 [Wolbachia pipientis]